MDIFSSAEITFEHIGIELFRINISRRVTMIRIGGVRQHFGTPSRSLLEIGYICEESLDHHFKRSFVISLFWCYPKVIAV